MDLLRFGKNDPYTSTGYPSSWSLSSLVYLLLLDPCPQERYGRMSLELNAGVPVSWRILISLHQVRDAQRVTGTMHGGCMDQGYSVPCVRGILMGADSRLHHLGVANEYAANPCALTFWSWCLGRPNLLNVLGRICRRSSSAGVCHSIKSRQKHLP